MHSINSTNSMHSTTPLEVYKLLVAKCLEHDVPIRQANIYAVKMTWKVFNFYWKNYRHIGIRHYLNHYYMDQFHPKASSSPGKQRKKIY